jgi:hypothetical protein
MFTWGDLLSGVIGGTFSSLVALLIAWWLMPRQFVQERWWERKAESYGRILESLTVLGFCYSEWSTELIGLRGISDARNQQLVGKYHEALEEIAKASAAGTFIVHPKVASLLRATLLRVRSGEHVEDEYEHLTEAEKTVSETIKEVKKMAFADLKLAPGPDLSA